MSDIVDRLRDANTTRRIGESYADTHERRQRDRDEAAARIEQLEAEVKVWQGHAKTAIWSDSEECKVLEAEVERLLNSRNRWAKKYNDLLVKRRAEDGYDVYAAAREEYRKKIIEQAARIEQLEAEGDKARARGDTLRMALEDIAYPNPLHNEDDLMRIARAALEERT